MVLITQNTKTKKSEKTSPKYRNRIMQFAPHSVVNHRSDNGKLETVCKHSSPECRKFCLYGTGYGIFENVKHPRMERTRYHHERPIEFKDQFLTEASNHARLASKASKTFAFRPNGFSDILWENECPELFDLDIQVYDYTKYPYHERPTETLPSNYHLTYSRSEKTTRQMMQDNLRNGRNVAVVFRDKLPDFYAFLGKGYKGKDVAGNYARSNVYWNVYSVIDGDVTDLRFNDHSPVIVGLKAKGNDIKKESSKFVIDDNYNSFGDIKMHPNYDTFFGDFSFQENKKTGHVYKVASDGIADPILMESATICYDYNRIDSGMDGTGFLNSALDHVMLG